MFENLRFNNEAFFRFFAVFHQTRSAYMLNITLENLRLCLKPEPDKNKICEV